MSKKQKTDKKALSTNTTNSQPEKDKAEVEGQVSNSPPTPEEVKRYREEVRQQMREADRKDAFLFACFAAPMLYKDLEEEGEIESHLTPEEMEEPEKHGYTKAAPADLTRIPAQWVKILKNKEDEN